METTTIDPNDQRIIDYSSYNGYLIYGYALYASHTTYTTSGGYSMPEEVDYYIIELEWKEGLHHQELKMVSMNDLNKIKEALQFVQRNRT